ncbi:hypothetical protein SAMN05443144_101217 [Fodinibius roseus]|uniref:ATP synthase I chain n=1 Tax=Fodinibius roseus TaxID=1194090 RepID=A0A1M4T5X5_9BACT|nr:hypothetical protein SAMN05443144_101217 [Fodinibius roseus]
MVEERYRYRNIVYTFLRWSILTLAGTLCYSFLWAPSHMGEMALAYLLSFLFVASYYPVLRNFREARHKIFYRRFLTVLALRFVFVLIMLVVILMVTKFHQIYFTVSFIILYILHSVIEIILINKVLQTDN